MASTEASGASRRTIFSPAPPGVRERENSGTVERLRTRQRAEGFEADSVVVGIGLHDEPDRTSNERVAGWWICAPGVPVERIVETVGAALAELDREHAGREART